MVLVVLAAGAAARADGPILVEAQPAGGGKLTATGRVQAVTSARISPRVAGHIAVFGHEQLKTGGAEEGGEGGTLDVGMRVKEGQELFRLDETTFRDAVNTAEATVSSAKAVLANLKAPTRPERIEQLRQALAELDAKVKDKLRDLERYRRLVEEDKTMPAKRLEEVQTDLAGMEANQKAAASRLLEAQNGPTETEIAVAEAAVKQTEAALKTAQDDLRDSVVRAPFDGLIVKRFKSAGDYVSNQPPVDVLELVSTDKLEAELHLPEAYFAAVEAGKTVVRVSGAGWKDAMELKVTRVIGDIDPAKGTFAFRVVVPAKMGLVSGAFVTGEVMVQGDEGAIVPQKAVRMESGRAMVTVMENGKAVKREVELGDRLTEGVVIKSGLKAGEKVVISAGS